MRNAQLRRKMESPDWEAKLPFDMLVAYEDTPTRDRAIHLCQHLSRQLLEDYDFRCSWWKFEHLANPLLSAQSTSAAKEANMIILSIHARAEVPLIHRQWVESWTGQKQRGKSALVALIGAPSVSDGDSSGTVKYLQSVARTAKMDFFDHSFELLPPNPTASANAEADPIAFAPEINLLHKMPIPRWGINE